VLNEDDFEILAPVMQARREEHGFLLTAWVFLPDPAAAGHTILGPRYVKGISLVRESVKVSSTRQINAQRGELGRLWQRRFFDRALPAPKRLRRRRSSRTPVRRTGLYGLRKKLPCCHSERSEESRHARFHGNTSG
jgi:hypothetical protein